MVSLIKEDAGLSFGRKYSVKETIPELLYWIEMNIDRPLLVKDVVIKSGYSAFYLQHAFASVTGESIARYIRRRKLIAAACLLLNCDSDIKGIAYSAGFNEISTFYRSFKCEFGLTPGEYRKRCMNSTGAIITVASLSEQGPVIPNPAGEGNLVSAGITSSAGDNGS